MVISGVIQYLLTGQIIFAAKNNAVFKAFKLVLIF